MERLSVELLILFFLIILNGLLAMAEMSLVSSRKARLEQRAGRGQKGARTALLLLENPTKLLSAIQVGITMIGVLTGVVGGAALADELAALAAGVPLLAPYSETIGIGIVVLVITYFTLIFGELIPKRVALTRPDAYASALAGPLWLLAKVGSPLIFILTRSTDGLLRLAGLNLPDEPVLVDEEIRNILNEGTRSGSVDMVEKRMVESVLRLDDSRVGALLTPRTEIEWIDLNGTPEEARELILSTGHSVYPVAREELDDVVGFVRARDVLSNLLASQPVPLDSQVIEGAFVPESTSALRVLELLKEHRKPLLFVVDEYGGLVGMVTLADILRAIVGDVPDAPRDDEPHVFVRDDGTLLVDGMMSINDFENDLPWKVAEGVMESRYHTMGGFIMDKLERVPVTGDKFDWQGMSFEVMDTDGLRVDKILVSKLQGTADSLSDVNGPTQ